MKRFFCFSLLVIMLLAVASPGVLAEADCTTECTPCKECEHECWHGLGTTTYIVIKTTRLNVREAPCLNAKRVGQLTEKAKVEVLDDLGEWAVIEYKGKVRYVMSKYLKPVATYLDCLEEKVTKFRVISEVRLNIRAGRSISSDRLGHLQSGQIVFVHSIEDGWAQICTQKGDAYVMARYLACAEPHECEECCHK